ncbi:TPA: tyrosine-type recombinase/integrase [Escherichia coli]|nr:tyrosine-type recombinase/integrase [Escherichia coli]HAN3603685.1 tyrosine-type recombinase/integrase [Escherichia coli]HAN3971681.1 tyrosine-type recombinase/integrase [Escherichia coli]
MNNVIPLQNSPERVSLLPIAPGVDFATALSLRRMATSTGATPAYLLAPEVSALLFYMPDQRHHMLFATLWNTGMRIGEARMLTPESFDLNGVRPFVRILSEKVRARRGRPPKDEVRLVPLTDISYVRQMESWMITTRPRRRAQMVKQFLSRDPFECVLCGGRMVYRRAIAGLNVSGLKKNARDISLLRYMPA